MRSGGVRARPRPRGGPAGRGPAPGAAGVSGPGPGGAGGPGGGPGGNPGEGAEWGRGRGLREGGPGEGPAEPVGRTWSAKSSAVPIRSFWPMAAAGGSASSLARSLGARPVGARARARCGLHRKCRRPASLLVRGSSGCHVGQALKGPRRGARPGRALKGPRAARRAQAPPTAREAPPSPLEAPPSPP